MVRLTLSWMAGLALLSGSFSLQSTQDKKAQQKKASQAAGFAWHTDLAEANRIEDQIDKMRKRFNNEAAARMQGGGDLKAEMLCIDLNNHLEKIGNHCLNVIEAAQGWES